MLRKQPNTQPRHSPETNNMFLKTETSLCEPRQTYVIADLTFEGFEMSQTW